MINSVAQCLHVSLCFDNIAHGFSYYCSVSRKSVTSVFLYFGAQILTFTLELNRKDEEKIEWKSFALCGAHTVNFPNFSKFNINIAFFFSACVISLCTEIVEKNCFNDQTIKFVYRHLPYTQYSTLNE